MPPVRSGAQFSEQSLELLGGSSHFGDAVLPRGRSRRHWLPQQLHMPTLFLVQLLFAALALVMAGLGLSLRVEDFRGLARRRRDVAIALALQMIVLPALAYWLARGFQLPGPIAAGMVLLAATPGSISANLYSHLFGGNVAFNIALTGVNTLLCALTLPLLSTWAIAHFTGVVVELPMLFDRAFQTVGIVVIPVVLGMIVAAKAPVFAHRIGKKVKIVSAIVVVVFSLAAIVKEWAALSDGFLQVGGAVIAFNVLSLAVGFGVARAFKVPRPETMTIAFQVSVHNAIQAIYVALAVLDAPLMALPAAVYSITMNLAALGFGVMMSRSRRAQAATAAVA